MSQFPEKDLTDGNSYFGDDYCYRNFDLAITIAKIIQNFFEKAKNENILKRDFREHFHEIYHDI